MWKSLWILVLIACVAVEGHRHQRERNQNRVKSRTTMPEDDDNIKQMLVMDILEGNMRKDIKLQKELKLITDPSMYEGELGSGTSFVLSQLKNNQLLSTSDVFDSTNQIHLIQLNGLSRLLIQARDWSVLVRILQACTLQQINRVLLVNALLLAISERPDARGIVLPRLPEILPDLLRVEQIMSRVEGGLSEDRMLRTGRRSLGDEMSNQQKTWQDWKMEKEDNRIWGMGPKKTWQEWKMEKEQNRQGQNNWKVVDVPMEVVEKTERIVPLDEDRLLRIGRRRMPMEDTSRILETRGGISMSEIEDDEEREGMWPLGRRMSVRPTVSGEDSRLLRLGRRRMMSNEDSDEQTRISQNEDVEDRLLHVGRRRMMNPTEEKTSIAEENRSVIDNEMVEDRLLRLGSRRMMTPDERSITSDDDVGEEDRLMRSERRRLLSSEDRPKISKENRSDIANQMEADRLLRLGRRRMMTSGERLRASQNEDEGERLLSLERRRLMSSEDTPRLSEDGRPDMQTDRLLGLGRRRTTTSGERTITSEEKPSSMEDDRLLLMGRRRQMTSASGTNETPEITPRVDNNMEENRLLRLGRRRMLTPESTTETRVKPSILQELHQSVMSAFNSPARIRGMNERAMSSIVKNDMPDQDRLLRVGRRRASDEVTPITEVRPHDVEKDEESRVYSSQNMQNIRGEGDDRILRVGRRRMMAEDKPTLLGTEQTDLISSLRPMTPIRRSELPVREEDLMQIDSERLVHIGRRHMMPLQTQRRLTEEDQE